MQKQTAVIFGSWCPGDKEMEMALISFNAIVDNFSDADIYVGINPPYNPKWIDILSKHNNVIINYVPESLEINSDASAIISALNALRISGNKYDNIYFGHSKSASTLKAGDAQLFVNNFWSQRQTINDILRIHENIGGVFPYSTILDEPKNNLGHLLKSTHYTPLPIMASMGFFAIKGDIVDKFIHDVSPDFYTKPLSDLGLDRYMLERDIPSLVSMYGKIPIPVRIHHHQEIIVHSELYNQILKKWKEQNEGLWIPRFRYKPIVDVSFQYCPPMFMIEALNLDDKDIPTGPPTCIIENDTIIKQDQIRTLPNGFYEYIGDNPLVGEQSSPKVGRLLNEYLSKKDHYDQLTDKEFTHRYLTEFYDKFFEENYNRTIKILEIGAYKGGSLELFTNAFNDSYMVTCDINPLLSSDKWVSPRHQLVKIDAYTLESVNKLKEIFGEFDVIIDDGPHTEASQFFSLEHYYNLLSPGGTLIIEDVASMPSAILMKTKFYDAEIIDLREKNPELYITDNVLVLRKKPF